MVDVPRALDPSDHERLDVLRRAMTAGNVDGESRAVGPIFRRDQLDAGVGGGGVDDDLDARDSKVDAFTVTDDATATFTLTYAPIEDSWNVALNGLRVHRDEFTISGQTLTIVDPATLFYGASDDATAWDLEVQYDYLSGAPIEVFGMASLLTASRGNYTGTTATTYEADMPTVAAGDLLLLAVATNNLLGAPAAPAGWDLVATSHSADAAVDSTVDVFSRIADGTETDLTGILFASSSRYNTVIVLIQGAGGIYSASTTDGYFGSAFTMPSVGVPGGGALVVYFTAGGRGSSGPGATFDGSLTSLGTRNEGTFSQLWTRYIVATSSPSLAAATSAADQSWAGVAVAVAG